MDSGPYTQSAEGFIWRGQTIVYPFKCSEGIVTILNYAYAAGAAAERERAKGLVEAMTSAIRRRHEWGDPPVGMCAQTAEYVVEPLLAAYEKGGQP